jgi:hypothetical protein
MTTNDVVVALLPLASVAVQTTVVVPTENSKGWNVMTGLGSVSSVAVAGVRVGEAGKVVVAKDCVVGAVMIGGVVSSGTAALMVIETVEMFDAKTGGCVALYVNESGPL